MRLPPRASSSSPAFASRRLALRAACLALPLAWPRRPAQAQPAGAAPHPPAPEAGTAAAEPAVPLPAIGTPLVLPEATLLDGSRFDPAAAEGRLLVLYWWASWCPFCAIQSPLMDTLWRTHHGRGLQLLGLSIDRKPDDAAAYLRRKGYAFPSAWVTPAFARALPKPKGLPVTVVRGRDGRVRLAEAGQLFPEDVEQIAELL